MQNSATLADWQRFLTWLRDAPSVTPKVTVNGDHFSFPIPGETLRRIYESEKPRQERAA